MEEDKQTSSAATSPNTGSVEEVGAPVEFDAAKAQEERMSAAREVLRAFMAVMKNIRLFNKEHSQVQTQRKILLDRLNKFLDAYGDLDFELEAIQILYLGISIHQVNRPMENPFFVLFQEGVRNIVFQPDLSEGEIDLFIESIAESNKIDATEDNAVTRLWEADLEHIEMNMLDLFSDKYIRVGDTESEEGDDGTEFDDLLSAALKDRLDPDDDISKEAASILAIHDSNLIGEHGLSELSEVEKAKELEERANTHELDPELVKHWCKELTRPPRNVPQRFIDVVLALNQGNNNREQIEAARDAIVAVVLEYVEVGQFQLAWDALLGLEGFLQNAPDLGLFDDEVFERLEETFPLGVRRLDEKQVKGAAAFWRRIPDSIQKKILRNLLRAPNSRLIRLLPQVVKVAGVETKKYLKDMMQTADPEVTAAFLELVVQVIGKGAKSIIDENLKRPEENVRRAAFMALSKLKPEEAAPEAVKLLFDKDLQIRERARYVLESLKDPRLVKIFEKGVYGKDFPNLGLDEKRAFLVSAGRLSRDGGLGFIRKLAGQGNLLSPMRTKETQSAALQALGILKDIDSLQMLEEQKKSLKNSQLIKSAAGYAISVIMRDKGKPASKGQASASSPQEQSKEQDSAKNAEAVTSVEGSAEKAPEAGAAGDKTEQGEAGQTQPAEKSAEAPAEASPVESSDTERAEETV